MSRFFPHGPFNSKAGPRGPSPNFVVPRNTTKESSMKHLIMTFVAAVSCLGAAALLADEVELETVPPVVVRTVPEAGADDVDPGVTEIKVTFSKDMMGGSFSWSTLSKESFPTVDGQPAYEDDKR